MGLILKFRSGPSPRGSDHANDCLATGMHVNVLHHHRLLALTAMPVEGVERGGAPSACMASQGPHSAISDLGRAGAIGREWRFRYCSSGYPTDPPRAAGWLKKHRVLAHGGGPRGRKALPINFCIARNFCRSAAFFVRTHLPTTWMLRKHHWGRSEMSPSHAGTDKAYVRIVR
jgi:hypothetical protein